MMHTRKPHRRKQRLTVVSFLESLVCVVGYFYIVLLGGSEVGLRFHPVCIWDMLLQSGRGAEEVSGMYKR
jgi:hypothetical protein